MGLLGTSMDDPQTAGILALAGQMIRGDMGGGLLGFGQAYQGAQNSLVDRADKLQQIKLRDLQAQMLQRKQDMLSSLLGGSDPSTPAPSAPASPAIGGAVGVSPVGGGMAAPGQPGAVAPVTGTPASGGNLVQRARALGIPEDAIRADLALNEGKGIAEMIYKRGAPDMQVTDGYAYDKNHLQGGFIPGITTSTDGTSSLRTIGPDGLPSISAPSGALTTRSDYTTATERAKNQQTPLPINYVGKNGSPIGGSLDAYLNPPASPMPSQGGGNMALPNGAQLNPQLQAAILADAQKNGITNPQISPQWQNAPGMRATTFGWKPDGSQSAQPMQLQGPAEAEAAKITATEAAKSGQTYKDSLDGKVEEEFQLVNRNKQITPLLDKFKTGGFAPEERLHLGNAIANSGMLPDGMKQQLGNWVASGDTSSGKVIENQLASAGILNMLQTLDKEGKPNRAIFQAVQKAQEGLNSGNTTLKDVFELQNRLYQIHYNEQQALTKSIKDGSYDPRTWAGDYSNMRNADLSKPAVPLPSAANAPAAPSGPAFAAMPPANPSNKGKFLRDTTSNKRYQSNGLSWVEVK